MSKNVSSTCALGTPRASSSSSYARYSLPCPTADAAWSSAIAEGRIGISIRRMPRAIAPEVTITTESPRLYSSAAWSQTVLRTSRRTSPASSATMLEPSLTTNVLTVPKGKPPALGAERRARVELEHHAADLDVVAGLEAGRLERADHADRAQALLEIAQRVLVADVVPRHEALDASPRDPEGAVAGALDREALAGARPVDAVLDELRLGLLLRAGLLRHVTEQRR